MLLILLACTLPGAPGVPAPPAPPEDVPATTTSPGTRSAADIKDRMARHAASLYFAGQTGETALAKWEIAKLREQIGELGGLTYNDVALGSAAHDALNGPLTSLEAAVAPAEHEAAYANLVAACNECHVKAGVSFITVTTPRNPPWSNVKYGDMGRGGAGARMGAGAGMGPGAGMGRGPGAEAAPGMAPGAKAEDGTRPQRQRRQGAGPRGGRAGEGQATP